MSFGTLTYHPSSITSYNAAIARYQSIKPVRGRADQNTRPLTANRSSDTLTIRMDGDCVVVRHWYTDIIRYLPDGSIEGVPYPSVTTRAVVSSLLRGVIYPSWTNSSDRCVTRVGEHFYLTPDFYTIKDGILIAGSVPFKIPNINRKLSKAACAEYRLPEFMLWLKTLVRLGSDPRTQHYSYQHQVPPITSMTDDANWASIAAALPAQWTMEHVSQQLRQMIYQREDVLTHTIVPYLENYSQLRSYEQLVAKYK